jgi:hypothetical protein
MIFSQTLSQEEQDFLTEIIDFYSSHSGKNFDAMSAKNMDYEMAEIGSDVIRQIRESRHIILSLAEKIK